ncbi:carbamoyltransferase [Cyclonatronum proteinivorum]|uniref:Carbamoyltransferase n=1 Tax=Cyclonatronum proteinivorum TaxID=1457365 RepID=A0A345UIX4_9BACT|nr:carbamoyltransferase [Cyclonatronum proteinivorum]AXJ00426.1 carbamoyltransferase [Cyclonatronum proteinivorum]
MVILGISCYYHDSAAALLRDGVLIAAAQEERFTRKKHDPGFPHNAIQYCLKEARITLKEVDAVAFYDKPFLKFERILETYLAFVPKGILSAWKALPLWIREKLWISDRIRTELKYEGKLLFSEHHESHAASAFFPSPFTKAGVLTMDGVGEWATSSIGSGEGNRVKLLKELNFPHSLGLLYSAFTYFTGFRVNSGEYKLMGLAPYGEPVYAQQIFDELMDLRADGSFRLNMDYFDYGAGLKMTSKKFAKLFGGPARKPETQIGKREMDLAASIQVVTEEIMLRMAKHTVTLSGSRNLCLAGGVALNCVGNGKLLRSGVIDDLWIQPAAGDAGGAVGAAYVAHYHYYAQQRPNPVGDAMQGSYLGPAFSDEDINMFAESNGYRYRRMPEEQLIEATAEALAAGEVVGWFQGRMEFGPRALGNRSILGDPRSEVMQKNLNLKIKYRESFRPFAPSVLREQVSEWFSLDRESPYMLLVAHVTENHLRKTAPETRGFDKLYEQRSDIPAVTHVDNSARIQTVDGQWNPRYHALISAFHQKTDCPVLINTSFNVRGEPIVCTPEDAWRCFMRTKMDRLVMGSLVFLKKDQEKQAESDEWKEEFVLD